MTFTIFHSLSGYSGVGGRNLRFCTRKKTRNGRNEETVHNFPTSRSRKGGKRYFLRNPIFFFGKLLYHTQLYLFLLLLSVGMDNFEALLSGAHFMVSGRKFSIIVFAALVHSNFR